MSATVTLGSVTLQAAEVPDRITFGGSQMLSVKKLIGGQRVVDAMGRDDIDLAWSGRFFGSQALNRALMVDQLRVAGAAITLAWSGLNYTVVIETFTADFEQQNNIPYSIKCVVVTNNAAPGSVSAAQTLNNQVSADVTLSGSLVSTLGVSSVTSGWSSVTSAIGTLTNFSGASRSVLAPISSAISSLQTTVSGLATSTNSSILGLSNGNFGGVTGGGSGLGATLQAQAASVTSLPILSNLSNTLGRLQTNLSSAVTSGAPIQAIGGTLYQMAANAYGNENEWPTIAAANNLIDPQLVGAQTITVPPTPGGDDGLFSL